MTAKTELTTKFATHSNMQSYVAMVTHLFSFFSNSQGSRLCHEQQVALEFWAKADALLETVTKNPKDTERTVSLICLFAFCNILHGDFSSSIPMLFRAYSLYLQKPSSVSRVVKNR
jgi:hypothetical protein